MVVRLLALSSLLLATATCAPRAPRSDRPAPIAEAAWVDQTLGRLSLREKVGQMIVPWVDGSYLAVGTPAYDRLRRWVEEDKVGGVIVSVGPPLEIAAKINLLQQMADVPLLVGADVERGPGQRLTGGTVLPWGIEAGGGTDFPPIMALGAARDERLAYEVGRITALEARAVGIHMAYAPVLDVNIDPANPIINTRSYGEDPALVARLGAAHVRGLQDHGLLATAKHFPGHGDVDVDSHLELPILDIDRARADSVELVPFRAAIDAGVAAVMAAHVAFPSLTGDSLPATLSPKLVEGLLRRELGFDGLVLVDALDMGAITRNFSPGRAAVRAIQAGADILLMPRDVAGTIDTVVAAVERGETTEARIDDSVRRILEAKARLSLHRERTVRLERVQDVVGSPEHLAVAEEVARRSITLVRDRDRLLPLRPERARSVLSIIYTDDVDPFAGRVFQRELRERFDRVRTFLLDTRSQGAELDAVREAAEGADVVVFAPFVRVLDRKGDLAIAEPVAALVRDIASRRPTVVATFGNPYVIGQLHGVGTYLLGWGHAAVSQRAAVRALVGEAPIEGRLPISLPGAGPLDASGDMDQRLSHARPEEVGMDPAVLERLDALLERATTDGAIPGAALAVGRRGRLVRLRGYGRLDHAPDAAPVTDSSLYDLASLTKVVATTTALMILDDEGRIDLDAPLSRYLLEWGGTPAKDRITLRHLLTHTAGLPPFLPLWKELRGKEAYLERIVSLDLDHAPGTRTVYSDFGPILLAHVVERVSGVPFDRFVHERILQPLGLNETGFNPLDWPLGQDAAEAIKAAGTPILARIAPTEVDTVLRMTHVHGVVHDENAWAMGGVAGHAGLFSSARDLAVFAQMMLNGGSYGGVRIVETETVRRYTARQDPRSSRALGWDTPAGRSSAGDYFSARAFGHTGFTGTSLWVDPEKDLFVVLLTNRVNPTRENTAHVALRREVHDLVQRAITDAPVAKRVDVARN